MQPNGVSFPPTKEKKYLEQSEGLHQLIFRLATKGTKSTAQVVEQLKDNLVNRGYAKVAP